MPERVYGRGLFGEGASVVLGLPSRFRLQRALKTAKSIRLAMAFARVSGWKLLSEAIEANTGAVRLLTGLHFCLTEPRLLRSWLRLSSNSPNFEAKVFSLHNPMFHPKVLLVRGGKGVPDFGIVGSGNMTSGGMRENVECGVYVDGEPLLRHLENWFDTLFDSDDCVPVSERRVRNYEPDYKKAAKSSSNAREHQEKAEKRMMREYVSAMAYWDEAVEEATDYFRRDEFQDWHKGHSDAARRILKALKYPSFNFGRQGWYDFYAIKNLGALRRSYKTLIWPHHKRLQKSLRRLVDEDRPIADRIDHMLKPGSPGHVPYFGMNAVSKVLASHRPKKWPVLNGPVRSALAKFGYQAPYGATEGQKYEAFARKMGEFLNETGGPDMIALDLYFCDTQEEYTWED